LSWHPHSNHMQPVARNHHFVPQCYLAGFTDTGTKTGRLCVLDFEASRFFRQRPRNVAFEVDFNRFETNSYAPDALERAFGQFEAMASQVVRKICTEECLPEDEQFSYVVNLITLLAIRNPALRRSMDTARNHMWRVVGDMLASDLSLYENHLRSARAGGFVTGKEVPFESVRDFIRKGEYTITYDSQEHLQRELRVFEKLLPEVGARCWSVLVAGPGAPDFITCDHPVSLVYKQTLFPLDARHALMGEKDGQAPERIVLQDKGVAEVNLRLFKLANRQIYSRSETVTVLDGETAVTLSLRKLAAP
jgi:uncharacterized protein DUF4238